MGFVAMWEEGTCDFVLGSVLHFALVCVGQNTGLQFAQLVWIPGAHSFFLDFPLACVILAFFICVIEIWVIFCSWKVYVMHIFPTAFSSHLRKGVCVWESKLRHIVSDIPYSWQAMPWISTEWSFHKQGECTSWLFCCFPSYGFIHIQKRYSL